MLAALVYFPLLEPGMAPFSPYSDIAAFHVGLKDVLYKALLAGELPLWRTDQMLGGPALTQPQALYLHPLQFLFLGLKPIHAFGLTFALELWLGAVGAYFMARALRVSHGSALLVGIAQLVCFKLIIACYAGWSSPLATIVLLPWLAAAWFRHAERPSLRTCFWIALVSVPLFAGGSPQLPYYLLLVLAAFPLVQARARMAQPPLREALSALSLAGLGLVGGIVCNSYLWLPVVADLPAISRAEQSYEFFLSGHALTVSQLLATALSPEWLGTPLDRSYSELWEDVAYFGLVPLLGVLSLVPRWRTLAPSIRYLLGAFALSLGLSVASPLLEWVYRLVPGYALFRLPARMLFVSALLGIALFGVALDVQLARLPAARLRLGQLVRTSLAVLMLAEGAFYAHNYLTVQRAERLEPDLDHPARGFSRDGMRSAVVGRGSLNYAWASSLGLELVNGYDPYTFSCVRDFMNLVEHGTLTAPSPSLWLDLKYLQRPDLLRELSVRHVLSQRALDRPELSFVAHHASVRNFVLYKGERLSDLWIYALREPLPRARLALAAVVVGSQRELVHALLQPDARGRAFTLAGPSAGAPGQPHADDTVSEVSRSSGHIALRVRTAAPRLLLLAEAFHRGWQATVDDRAMPVVQANLALLGVWIPPGSHRVALTFRPLYFSLGLWLSALGLCILIVSAVLIALSARKVSRSRAGQEQDRTEESA